MADKDEPDVHQAYALKTPEDSKRLYASWASTYDQTFAEKTGFAFPRQVADLFYANGGTGPVLDAGAGTGLVAEEILKAGPCTIDAVDISSEMLNEAGAKGVYRELVEADLTEPLPIEDSAYNAVVSSGTFTHGHVGPDALDELLRVGRSGGLYVLTIKKAHFVEKGFQAKFETFGSLIRNVELHDRPVYEVDDGTDANEGLIAVFRKT